MSAQLRSRALQEGRVKALRRMKQPMALVLETSPGARGWHVAGQHIQSRGAQRRADRMALQALMQMRFDRAFIGACSVSEEGVGAAQLADATFKRAVVARAARTVALIASDKLGRAAPHQVAALGQIDLLVVEASASAAQRAALDAAGCRGILIADPA